MNLDNYKRFFWFICLLISLLSCSDPRKELLRSISETPAKNLRPYEFDKTSPLISRVKPAPDFVISFWSKTDKTANYSSYTLSKEELLMIDYYISMLPRRIKEVLQDRLVAVYFINNLLGSGVTDYVVDHDGNLYTVMLFNPATLRTDISTWMTYRENTCFMADTADLRLEIDCGTKYTGFLYVLTHESAHVIDYVESHTPYIEKHARILKQTKTTATDFTKDSWAALERPLKSYNCELRKDIAFYGTRGGPKIKISEANRLYECLVTTPFVSLYGSMNWAEDFAESVFYYHMTQVLGQSYQIRLIKNGDTVSVFRPMESAKVKDKFLILQQLY